MRRCSRSPAMVIWVARNAVASTSMASFSTGVDQDMTSVRLPRSTEANSRTMAWRALIKTPS